MRISLTYDYELFFGKKSGTPMNALLRPTAELLKAFRRLGLKGTFFVDVTYYLRLLENPSTQSDANLIKHQLQELVEQGSRIELHLHPHWLDAKYLGGGEWSFPTYEHYRLQSLLKSKITELFVEGTRALEEIAREVKPSYKVVAFRAGGWCAQPFDLLMEGIVKAGIMIDSSVAHGFAELSSSAHYFDFRNAPQKSIYRFNDDPTIEDIGGGLIEVPITTYSIGFLEKLRYKLLGQLIAKSHKMPLYGDGNGMLMSNPRLSEKFKTTKRMASFDFTIPEEVVYKLTNAQCELVNFIAHPKALSNMSIDTLEKISSLGYECITLNELL
jgi:hypothetical protein